MCLNQKFYFKTPGTNTDVIILCNNGRDTNFRRKRCVLIVVGCFLYFTVLNEHGRPVHNVYTHGFFSTANTKMRFSAILEFWTELNTSRTERIILPLIKYKYNFAIKYRILFSRHVVYVSVCDCIEFNQKTTIQVVPSLLLLFFFNANEFNA